MNVQSNVTTPFSSLIRSSIRITNNATVTTKPASIHDPKATTPISTTSTTIPLSSYVILLQYSFSLHNRLLAAEPSSSSRSYQEHQKAGLTPPKEIANCDLVGGVSFVKLAMEECINLCVGRVVIVKCLDRYQNDWDEEGGGDDDGDTHRSTLFRENGVVVDLASDPLGWDDDDNDDDTAVEKEDEDKQRRTVKGRIDKLHSVFQAIQRAIEIIQTCNPKPSPIVTHRNDHNMNSQKEGRRRRQQQQQQPPNLQQRQSIPIIFDSIAPLILHHGVPKFQQLLQQLKLKSDEDMNNTSPIILPILTETITPFHIRQLEDSSDAVLTVDGGVATIARRSARLGGMHSASLGCGGVRLIKEVQHFQISGRDLILSSSKNNQGEVGGGTSNNSNTSESRNLPKVTKRNSTNASVGGRSGGGDGIASGVRRLGLGNSVVDDQASGNTTNASHAKSGRRQLLLQHEDEEQKMTSPAPSTSQTSNDEARPKPRIYMEENDPEFDDLDEEDPDDDLDI